MAAKKIRRVKPVFQKIEMHEFERLSESEVQYGTTEVNGFRLLVAYTPEDNILGVYYVGKGYGSKMISGDMTKDVIAYVEADEFWPEDWN